MADQQAPPRRRRSRRARDGRTAAAASLVGAMFVGSSNNPAVAAFQAPTSISAPTAGTCSSFSIRTGNAAGRGRDVVPPPRSRARMRPRWEASHQGRWDYTSLLASDQQSDDYEPDDEPNNDDEGGGAASSETNSLDEISCLEETIDLADCVTLGCSIDYIDAIAKLSAEQDMDVLAGGTTSSSEVLVGDIVPIVGSSSAKDGRSNADSSSVTAEGQARSIETIRDDAIERSSAKKKQKKGIPSY